MIWSDFFSALLTSLKYIFVSNTSNTVKDEPGCTKNEVFSRFEFDVSEKKEGPYRNEYTVSTLVQNKIILIYIYIE